jgi:hypothetical protein
VVEALLTAGAAVDLQDNDDNDDDDDDDGAFTQHSANIQSTSGDHDLFKR